MRIVGSLVLGFVGGGSPDCQSAINRESGKLWEFIKHTLEPTIEYRLAIHPDRNPYEPVDGWDELLASGIHAVDDACNREADGWLIPIMEHLERIERHVAVGFEMAEDDGEVLEKTLGRWVDVLSAVSDEAGMRNLGENIGHYFRKQDGPQSSDPEDHVIVTHNTDKSKLMKFLRLSFAVPAETFANGLKAFRLSPREARLLHDSFNAWEEVEREFDFNFWEIMKLPWNQDMANRLDKLSDLIYNTLGLLDHRFHESVENAALMRLSIIQGLFKIIRNFEAEQFEESVKESISFAIGSVENHSLSLEDVKLSARFVETLVERIVHLSSPVQAMKASFEDSALCMSKFWNFVTQKRRSAIASARESVASMNPDIVKLRIRGEVEMGLGSDRNCNRVWQQRKQEAVELVLDSLHSAIAGDIKMIETPRSSVNVEGYARSYAFMVLESVSNRVFFETSRDRISIDEVESVLKQVRDGMYSEHKALITSGTIRALAAELVDWFNQAVRNHRDLTGTILNNEWSADMLEKIQRLEKSQDRVLAESSPMLRGPVLLSFKPWTHVGLAVERFMKKWLRKPEGQLIKQLGSDLAQSLIVTGVKGSDWFWTRGTQLVNSAIVGIEKTLSQEFADEIAYLSREIENARKCMHNHIAFVDSRIGEIRNVGDWNAVNLNFLARDIHTAVEKRMTISESCSEEASEYIRSNAADLLVGMFDSELRTGRAKTWLGFNVGWIEKIVSSVLEARNEESEFVQEDPEIKLSNTLKQLVMRSEMEEVDVQGALAVIGLADEDVEVIAKGLRAWIDVDVKFDRIFWDIVAGDWSEPGQRRLKTMFSQISDVVHRIDARVRQAVMETAQVRLWMIERLLEIIRAYEFIHQPGLLASAFEEFFLVSETIIANKCITERECLREWNFVDSIAIRAGGIPEHLADRFWALKRSAECFGLFWRKVNVLKLKAEREAMNLNAREGLITEIQGIIGPGGVCSDVLENRQEEAWSFVLECFDSAAKGHSNCITYPVVDGSVNWRRFGSQPDIVVSPPLEEQCETIIADMTKFVNENAKVQIQIEIFRGAPLEGISAFDGFSGLVERSVVCDEVSGFVEQRNELLERLNGYRNMFIDSMELERRVQSFRRSFAMSLMAVNAEVFTGALRADEIESAVHGMESEIEKLIEKFKLKYPEGYSEVTPETMRWSTQRTARLAREAAAGFRAAKFTPSYGKSIHQAFKILKPITVIVRESLRDDFDASKLANRIVENNRILIPSAGDRDEEFAAELKRIVERLLNGNI